MKTIGITAMLFLSQLGQAQEVKVVKAYNQIQLARVESVVIQPYSVNLSDEDTRWMRTRMNVFANLVFSNSCMVTQGFLVSREEGSTESNINYKLESLDVARACPMNFDPVTVRVHLETLYTDIMPIVQVNGIAGVIERN